MTLKETMQADGVGMRWLRTAATTVSSIAVALGFIYVGLVWLVEPRFYQWAESIVDEATKHMQLELDQTGVHLDRLDIIVDRLDENISKLATASVLNTDPSFEFNSGTSISDGHIGGVVNISVVGVKIRDCGVPTIEHYFKNGGNRFHRFTDVSILGYDGRAFALPPMPDSLSRVDYTARIPADDGVHPGRAVGWISVTYPAKCPYVPTVTSGPLQFRILEGEPAQ